MSSGPDLAVIYTRVSTTEQVTNFSLSNQRRYCEEFCARHGWSVVRVFEERGESAKTADRTELQQLISFVTKRQNRIKYVVVYDVSRFSRNTSDFHALEQALGKCGVLLQFATQTVDETAVGRFTKNMLVGFAQFDNDVRTEKTIFGMKAALESGAWTWKIPRGYRRVVGSTGRSVIEPDPESAPLVRKAFEMFASGAYTAEEVRQHVGALGLSGTDGEPIDRQTFNSLLRNVFYLGVVHARKWGITARGNHAPIISRDLFEAVQRRLEGRTVSRPKRQRERGEFPLKGFIVCGSCGLKLTASLSKGRSGARHGYYFCRACKGMSVRSELLHEQFRSLLADLQPNPVHVQLLNESLRAAWEETKQRLGCTPCGIARAE